MHGRAGILHDSFELITSASRAATQSIDHLHIHLPQSSDDGLMTPWGTIQSDDPTGPRWCTAAQSDDQTVDDRVGDQVR
ncbi:hypothetical protein GCM10009789_37780 [Kribbella sancticallisti]|uniref:Uncharacterized protein n=1 Tax=Kribbella sancticallisti TaxID=460087 RepID=A0ABN2DPN0_9ACTN